MNGGLSKKAADFGCVVVNAQLPAHNEQKTNREILLFTLLSRIPMY
jgi:hypothetical protein